MEKVKATNVYKTFDIPSEPIGAKIVDIADKLLHPMRGSKDITLYLSAKSGNIALKFSEDSRTKILNALKNCQYNNGELYIEENQNEVYILYENNSKSANNDVADDFIRDINSKRTKNISIETRVLSNKGNPIFLPSHLINDIKSDFEDENACRKYDFYLSPNTIKKSFEEGKRIEINNDAVVINNKKNGCYRQEWSHKPHNDCLMETVSYIINHNVITGLDLRKN
ncbi:MAG: hypothetical protein ACQER9_02465 [Nanobdellota archaeon]